MGERAGDVLGAECGASTESPAPAHPEGSSLAGADQ